MSSKHRTEQRPPEPQGPRARVIVLWEDTVDGRPRTWCVGLGSIALEHANLIDLDDREPESNSGMAKAKAFRYLDEMNLVGDEP